MKTDGLPKNGCCAVQVADDDLAVLRATYGQEQGYSGKRKDDLTGQVFKDDLILQLGLSNCSISISKESRRRPRAT